MASISDFASDYTSYIAATFVVFLFVFRLYSTERADIAKIPLIDGSSTSQNPLAYYLGVVRFLVDANEIVLHAYNANPTSGIVRIPRLFGWHYLIWGEQHVREIASAPEHVLGFNAATAEELQTKWTVGRQITDDAWHANTVRGSLTRNLSRCFPEVRDEIVLAFDEILGKQLDGTEWKAFRIQEMTMQIVARTSNRLFVGVPLCRVPEWIQMNIDYTINAFVRAQIISLLPEFTKPIIAPLISSKNRSLRHALRFLLPVLKERLESELVQGKERPDRPNDLISWLLDYAPDYERDEKAIALRILAVNASAIHTSSTARLAALTMALFDLAAYPEHIGPMREEVERVIASEGWTRAALKQMHKLDSFLRESLRLGVVVMARRVMRPEGFTFSDGTSIPQGAIMSVPSYAIQINPASFADPMKFDGFRFSRARDSESDHQC
ncbi:Cytochrome P450 [Mycena chlorophos]|uniref:Cytochrome P450 n=1 Tax=Mycena chlorophos TaxID=658473 RepID=A0A8H6TNW5_MYCCL|nr:Cytochrome P450 [Mycena chlorophos]